MSPSSLSDETAHELLDAYLDGELDATELAEVESLLARSAEARAELAAIDRVRSAVRGLRPVDPPFGTYERFGRHPARPRPIRTAVLAGMAAAATVAVLFATFTPIAETLEPPLDRFVERHEAMADEPSSGGFEPMALDEMAPPTLAGGFEPMAAYASATADQIVYSDGATTVSVFAQPGRADWSGLPDDGSMMMMGDDKAWHRRDGVSEVVVVERDDHVLTVVSDPPESAALAVADEMPVMSRPSFADRLRDGVRDLARAFGYPG
jgi:anti-sigma factor RsiW